MNTNLGLIWLKNAFGFVSVLFSTVLAFFLPVGGLVITAYTAIVLDAFTGTLASYKSGVKIVSKKAWNTPQKFLTATLLICGFQIIHVMMIEPLPKVPVLGDYLVNLSLSYVVTFSILWAEILSINENIERMYGWNIVDLIKRRLPFLKKNDSDKEQQL